jgi:hypothetical protein
MTKPRAPAAFPIFELPQQPASPREPAAPREPLVWFKGGADVETFAGNIYVQVSTDGIGQDPNDTKNRELSVVLACGEGVMTAAELDGQQSPTKCGFGGRRYTKITFHGEWEIEGAAEAYEAIARLIRHGLKAIPEFRDGPLQSITVRQDEKGLVIGVNLKRPLKKERPVDAS